MLLATDTPIGPHCEELGLALEILHVWVRGADAKDGVTLLTIEATSRVVMQDFGVLRELEQRFRLFLTTNSGRS